MANISVSVSHLSAIPDTADFIITNETHTAASVIVERLASDPKCEFSAYRVDHPMDKFVSIRVTGKNGETPESVMRGCLISIIKDIEDIIVQVRKYH